MGRHKLKVNEWKKIYQANSNQKRTGMAILTSDKIDFKTKIVTRDKRTFYIDKRVNLSRRFNNYKHKCT